MASGIITALRHFLARAVDPVLRDLLGRDYFISYARRDAAGYAAHLAKLLGEQHSVYLDQLDTPRGPELPPRLRHALRRASMLVLVGSPEAARSAAVRDELTLFLPTGRQAILIDIDRALDQAPWRDPPWSSLSGVYRQSESRTAFDGVEVSANVLAYIRDSFTTTRQDVRLRRRALLAGAAIAAAAVSVGVALWVAGDARTAAAESEERVRVASRQAEAATEIANAAGAQAATAQADAMKARTQEAAALGDAAQARTQEAGARANAALQQRIATSRRLAGESSSRLARQPDLGLLLAAHALDAYPTDEARRVLFDAVIRSTSLEQIVRDGHDVTMHRTAASADGRWLATRDIHGGTLLWNVRVRRSIPLLAPSVAKGKAENRGSLAFSPSGRLLAVSNTGTAQVGRVDMWELGDEPRRLDSLPPADHMAFVSEKVLAIASNLPALDPTLMIDAIRFLDISNPSAPVPYPHRLAVEGSLQGLVAEPRLELLIVRDAKGLMICRAPCDQGDRLPDDSWERGMVPGVAVSHGPRPLLAAMIRGGSVRIWDAERRRALTTIRPLLRLPTRMDRLDVGVALSPDGGRLAVAGEGGIVVVDLAGIEYGKPLTQRVIDHGPDVVAIEFVGDDRLAVAQTDGAVAFLDPARLVAPSRTHVRPREIQGPFEYDTSADGSRVLMTRDPSLFLWMPGAGFPPVQLPHGFNGPIWDAALSADGQVIAAVGADRRRPPESILTIWDGNGRQCLRQSISSDSPAHALEFLGTGRDKRLAVILESGALRVYGLKDPCNPRLAFVGALEPSIWMHAFDRSGRRLVTTDVNRKSGRVRLLDLDRKHLDLLKTDTYELRTLGFGPDGRTLVGFLKQPYAGIIVSWDLSRPSAPATRLTLYNHDRDKGVSFRSDLLPGTFDAVSMSSDARLLAFTDQPWASSQGTGAGAGPREGDGRLVLWDVERRLPIGRMKLRASPNAVRFSADGTQIFAFFDDALTVVDIDATRLAAHACAIAARRLTTAEMTEFELARPLPAVCDPNTRMVRVRPGL